VPPGRPEVESTGVRELAVPGAFEVTPAVHRDDRGEFLEWFKAEQFTAFAGHALDLAQANCSVSAAGTLRGIHFADVPPSQAKYVTCMSGAVLDVVVDIRVGSPTFGQWDSVLLDDTTHRAVYLSEGLGHAFMALADGAVVTYLCSAGYSPTREHGIHPLDPELGIAWPTEGADGEPLTPRLSPKDEQAPTLAEARSSGLLPAYDAVQGFLTSLRGD
jgi:dTDP-4-dehydrorhamnose 3,5-epimerase